MYVLVTVLHQKDYQRIIFDILGFTELEKLRPYMPADSAFSCKAYGPGIQISYRLSFLP